MIYLDNAATSHPKPSGVYRQVLRAMRRCGNPGRGAHQFSTEAANVLMNARDELAQLLGAEDAFNFVLCFNATDALNMAINALVQPGAHVLTTALEHNSVLRPLYYLCKQREAILEVLPPMAGRAAVGVAQIQAALRPNTCLCAVNAASNVTGALQPVKEIALLCRQKGVPLLVDGSQQVGHIPVDLTEMGVDFYAFPGHKGLMGPQGTGVLYIRTGQTLSPYRLGGTGSDSQSMAQPPYLPDKLESGTHNTPGIAGMAEGVKFVRTHMKEITEKEDFLTQRLRDGLAGIKGIQTLPTTTHHAAVVSFTFHNMPSSEAVDRLSGVGIALRGGLHCAPRVHQHFGTFKTGAVRASPGFFNTKAEIDRLLHLVSLMAKERE